MAKAAFRELLTTCIFFMLLPAINISSTYIKSAIKAFSIFLMNKELYAFE